MSFYKHLILIAITTFIIGCDSSKDLNQNFSITTSTEKNAVQNGGKITFSLKAKKEYTIDSVVYNLNSTRIGAAGSDTQLNTTIGSKTLGYKNINATIYTQSGKTYASTTLAILNNKRPKVYNYKIVNRYPKQTENTFLQGLEFNGDTLYESHGNYKESKLRKVNYKTGEVYAEHKNADRYFAEGLTLINNEIIQLTWKEDIGFVYDMGNLKEKRTFNYGNSKQGWGLCNDGNTVYKSDGSSKIWKLDPTTLEEKGFIEVATNTGVKSLFNELEWVNGKIYANTWPKNGATDKKKLKESISIINPETGALEALIDLRPLRKEASTTQNRGLEVLNGIAYKADEDRLFVTGKNWDTLFEIEIIK